MDNAYTSGFDYDVLREAPDAHRYALYVHEDPPAFSGRPRRRMAAVLSIVSLLMLVLAWYALRFIPAFDIDRIEFTVEGGYASVPREAARMANEFMGASLMSNAPASLQKALETVPVIQSVSIHRRFPSTAHVSLVIHDPHLFIASVDGSDQIEAIHFVNEGTLVPITMEDFRLFGNRVFVVEVSPEYARHLVAHGIDEGMREVVSLASEMGLDEDGRYRIVGRIRYEENLTKGFGHMVMELPAWHSILHIRQPISESRLHDALRLIKLEQESATTRNIALIGQLRYDLYARSMVRRR
jgi:hypothetical protein